MPKDIKEKPCFVCQDCGRNFSSKYARKVHTCAAETAIGQAFVKAMPITLEDKLRRANLAADAMRKAGTAQKIG